MFNADSGSNGLPIHIGGFTTREAQEMVRLLAGVNIVAADVVEVSPPFDVEGMTALVGATMMFELLCVMAGMIDKARKASSRTVINVHTVLDIGVSRIP